MNYLIPALFLISFISIIIGIYIFVQTFQSREDFIVIGTLGTQTGLADFIKVVPPESIPLQEVEAMRKEKKAEEVALKKKQEEEKKQKEEAAKAAILKKEEDDRAKAIEEEADKNRDDAYLTTLLNHIKEDLDLEPSVAFYYSDSFQKTSMHNKVFTISILADPSMTAAKYSIYSLTFNTNDIQIKIIKSFVVKQTAEFPLMIERFHINKVSESTDNIKRFAYIECADLIRKLRRLKSQINTPSDIFDKLNKDEKQKYDVALNKFYASYIDAYITDSANPLQNVSMNYELYLESIRSKNKNYAIILPELTRGLNMQKLNASFKQDILVYIDVYNKSKEFFTQGLYNAVKEDGSCFQENMGELEIEMRPCTLHFTDYYNHCETFADLYKLSAMQLQILINKNAEVFQILKLSSGHQYLIYIYDNGFTTFVELFARYKILTELLENPERLNHFHIPILIGYLRKRLNIDIDKAVYGARFDKELDTFCRKIWLDIFRLKVSYKGKQYSCIEISRVQKRKREDPSMQLCKIQFGDELKEIHKIYGDDKEYERKLYKYQYSNKPALWGSCFYSLKTGENADAIVNKYQKDYGLSSQCIENPVLSNLKCKDGCASNNQNKFIAFDVEPIGDNLSPYILNPRLTIPENAIFLKLSLKNWDENKRESMIQQRKVNTNNIEWINKHYYECIITFAKFNNQTKEFYSFNDRNTINQLMKNQLFTIRVDSNSVYLSPNNIRRNVYVCSFYNNKVYEYQVLTADISLAEFTVENINLKHLSPYADIYQKIINDRQALSCNNDAQENMNNMINCINALKNTINQNVLKKLNNDKRTEENNLTNVENEKRYNETQLNNKQNELNIHNTLAWHCDTNNSQYPLLSFWINTTNSIITNTRNSLNAEQSYLNNLRREEGAIIRFLKKHGFLIWVKIAEEIKLKINRNSQWNASNKINGFNQKISQLENYVQTLTRQCDAIRNTKNAVSSSVNQWKTNVDNNNRSIARLRANIQQLTVQINDINAGRGSNYLKNVEDYHIHSYDFYTNIYQRITNIYASYQLLNKYLYGEHMYMSNDNAIYIQIV